MQLIHQTELLSRRMCGDDVLRFSLARPEGYRFTAGQWARVTIETGAGPETRTLSHASAPLDHELEFVTRLSGSAFKTALASAEPGSILGLVGPGGRFALHGGDRLPVFLVGGVGVSPIRSILRDARERGDDLAGWLLMYGNRDDSCVPFREEIREFTTHGLAVVTVLERGGRAAGVEEGIITADLVRGYTSDPPARAYYLAGPPPMVEAMGRILDELEVPKDQRYVEAFR